MARLKDGLNLNGTLGKLVFYQRNGMNYVRTKPAKYRDAKSESQLLVRGRFAECNRFYSMLNADIFRTAWKVAAKGMGKNAKNLFMQYNSYAFGKDKECVDYDRLHFSAGTLPLPDNLQIKRHNNHDCIIEWEYNRQKGIGSPTDKLYIVELQKELKVHFHETEIRRSEGKVTFSTFENIEEHTQLYCFWGNEQATSFSESFHFVQITLTEP